MKTLSVITGILLVSSFGLNAQSLQQTAPSIASFSGQIEAGAESDISGDFKDLPNSNAIGAYVNPTLGLDLNFEPAKVSLGYGFYSFVAGGYGSGKEAKSLADNTYFEHNPNIKISGNITNTLSAAFLTDFVWRNFTGDQGNNYTELVMEPSLTYKLNGANSISLAYYFYRTESTDSDMFRKTGDNDIRSSLSLDSRALAETIDKANGSTKTYHQAKVTWNYKINNRVNWNTYVRAGKKFVSTRDLSDAAAPKDDAMAYRVHSTLSADVTSKLNLTAFYRFNIEDAANVGYQNFYNRADITLAYDLGNNWGVELEADSLVYGSSTSKVFNNYDNSTYAGMTYKF